MIEITQVETQRNTLENEKNKDLFDYISIVSQAIQYLINTSKSQRISFTCKSLKKIIKKQSGVILSGCKVRFGLYELIPEYQIKIIKNSQKHRYSLDNPIFLK